MSNFNYIEFCKIYCKLLNLKIHDFIKQYKEIKNTFFIEKVKELLEDPDFDIEFYRKCNSDLPDFSFIELIHHYKNDGKKEGRFGSEKQMKDFVDDNDFHFTQYKNSKPELKELMPIPIFHDDQHGTAIVGLAGLINSLEISGKKIEDIKIVCNGAGAAGIALIKLF
jgi:hypothetical protein